MTRKRGMFIKPSPFLDVGPRYLKSTKTFRDLGDDGDINSLLTLFKPACKPTISSFPLFNLQQFNRKNICFLKIKLTIFLLKKNYF